jgi:hypothetical protein
MFAALDELAAAGVLEYRADDAGHLSTQLLRQPSAEELLGMSHLAARVWLTLCRMQRDLEMLAQAERN